MRILFIGDVVGRSGRTIVTDRLPDLIGKWKLDLVVINGENAAGGFGITEVIYNELIDASRRAGLVGALGSFSTCASRGRTGEFKTAPRYPFQDRSGADAG
jgi:hypothetical protein